MLVQNQQYYENTTFENEDFSKHVFDDFTFSNCVFVKCKFTDCSFKKANVWQCTFQECDFSLVNLKDAVLRDVLFENSKLMGINFSSCDTKLFFSIKIINSLAQFCNFLDLTMEKSSFKESRVIQSKFLGTNLKKSCFVAADLTGTVFQQCDLRQANFKKAINYRIHPCENKIPKAQFSFPECIGILQALDIVLDGH